MAKDAANLRRRDCSGALRDRGDVAKSEVTLKKWYSLIDKVYRMDNLILSYRSVRANKGSPGIDGVSVFDFGENLEENLARLHNDLKTGIYEPSPVLRVMIPKPDGTQRPLGIPTVRDRVVQQALLNVLCPIFDPGFHPSSYGYRPGRSCHKAVAKAEMFVNRYDLKYVVDMDLSRCFDRLNHELILSGVNRRVSDGSVLKLIRKFLESGIMKDNHFEPTEIGSPQGGVISPLLMNIYLDEFDQKMKSKGIRIVRYADDILIFASTPGRASEYMKKAVDILENDLKLVVNREKTHLTDAYEGIPYLGLVIRSDYVAISAVKVKSFKDAVRALTRRNHGGNLPETVKRLNTLLRGWGNYFRIANCKCLFKDLMQWIRRRLRMMQMREWKSWKPLHKMLKRRGYKGDFAKISMRRWRNSSSPLIHYALPNSWFDELGLVNLCSLKVGILSCFR